MFKNASVAIALTLLAASPSWAVTTVIGGHHIIGGPGEQTFPIIATSDSGEMLSGIDLYIVMDPLGPVITKVELINGTVFEPNNVGQSDFGDPLYETPTREPAYFTTTSSGTVPTGIVALITVDWTGIAPGVYEFALESPVFGPSAVYNDIGQPGGYVNGTLGIPEPSSVVMAIFGLIGLAAVAFRRHCARVA